MLRIHSGNCMPLQTIRELQPPQYLCSRGHQPVQESQQFVGRGEAIPLPSASTERQPWVCTTPLYYKGENFRYLGQSSSPRSEIILQL